MAEEAEEIVTRRFAAAEAQILQESKKIDFYITEFSLELLANKMANGEFTIPEYQRADTWEDSRKSRFIESILMGLPIPFLFFWERPDSGKLEIIDGSQRLRTIQQFIRGERVLDGLDVLNELNGMKFANFSKARRRKVENKSVRGIVLNEHVDEPSLFEIFNRINTSSKTANGAEIRRGALSGAFLAMCIDLSKTDRFVKLAPVPDKAMHEREREELVTRFFAYGDGFKDGLVGYHDRPSEYLFRYTRAMNSVFAKHPARETDYRERFHKTMQFISKYFPHGFRKTPKATTTRRSRFEAIAVGCYLALQSNPGLEGNKPDILKWLAGSPFNEAVGSDGANVESRLRGRVDFVRYELLAGGE